MEIGHGIKEIQGTKMKHMNNTANNDTVYLAYKKSLNRHPQECRIGICGGTPVLDAGWHLFSYVKGEYADEIYTDILKSLNDLRETNFDLNDAAWLLPINGLDGMLAVEAKLLRARYPDMPPMLYFKDPFALDG